MILLEDKIICVNASSARTQSLSPQDGTFTLYVIATRNNISAQIIDNDDQVIESLQILYKKFLGYDTQDEIAQNVGAAIAKKAIAQGITEVFFESLQDSSYTTVKALAEAAREAGLKFYTKY